MGPLEPELRALLAQRGVVPKGIHLVSQSYSLVYRVRTQNGADWAVLFRRPNKRIEELRAELEITRGLALQSHGKLQCPVLVDLPSMGGEDCIELKVGGRFLSIFHWIEHAPFDGSPEEVLSAFTGFSGLRPRLRKLSCPPGLSTLALLRDDFTATSLDFARYAGCVPTRDSWAKAYRQHMPLLDRAVQLLAEGLLRHRSRIMSLQKSIIHYDPSPRNFGFGMNKNAVCIFDFDQCKWGIQEYDLPWMLWSFAAHRLPLEEADARDELIRRLSLYYRWLEREGSDVEGGLLWFFLLFRFCITLHGRLRDTYERGFQNLRFMEEKVWALVALIQDMERLPA